MPSNTYICDFCKTQFFSFNEAMDCEFRHQKQNFDKRWLAQFPTRHSKDDLRKDHCVNCGLLVRSYNTYDDEGVEMRSWNESFLSVASETFLGGRYCSPCEHSKKLQMVTALEALNAMSKV